MPYWSNDELPPSVRQHLSPHAQSIFREAFNHAFESPDDEAVARRIAWAAVKRRYEKIGDDWVPKESDPAASPGRKARARTLLRPSV